MSIKNIWSNRVANKKKKLVTSTSGLHIETIDADNVQLLVHIVNEYQTFYKNERKMIAEVRQRFFA